MRPEIEPPVYQNGRDSGMDEGRKRTVDSKNSILPDVQQMKPITRREFMIVAGGSTVATLLASCAPQPQKVDTKPNGSPRANPSELAAANVTDFLNLYIHSLPEDEAKAMSGYLQNSTAEITMVTEDNGEHYIPERYTLGNDLFSKVNLTDASGNSSVLMFKLNSFNANRSKLFDLRKTVNGDVVGIDRMSGYPGLIADGAFMKDTSGQMVPNPSATWQISWGRDNVYDPLIRQDKGPQGLPLQKVDISGKISVDNGMTSMASFHQEIPPTPQPPISKGTVVPDLDPQRVGFYVPEVRSAVGRNLPNLVPPLPPTIEPPKGDWSVSFDAVDVAIKASPSDDANITFAIAQIDTDTNEWKWQPNMRVTAEAWASNEKLQVQPEQMFPYVGGVNHANRNYIDMALKDARLVVDAGRDLTRVTDQKTMREQLAAGLDNTAFKAQVLAAQANVLASEAYKGVYDPKNIKFIVEAGFVTSAVLLDAKGKLRRFKVERDGTATLLKKEEEPQLLPELRINGPYIERADTGEKVEFKGITLFLNDGERKQAGSIFKFVKNCVEANERLGVKSNFVRLAFWSKDSEASEFEDVAKYLASKGIYMVVTPNNPPDNADGDRFLPNEKDKTILEDMANLFINESNVVYGLWNEPANTTWAIWSQKIKEISNRVKKVFAGSRRSPLFMVAGIDWGSDFRNAQIPLNDGEYFVDVHEYPTVIGEDITYKYERMIGKVPLIFTEFAGFVPGRPDQVKIQSDDDIKRMRRILDIVDDPDNQYKVHYAVWRGDASLEGLRTLGDAGLSARGRLIKKERDQFPQTDFLN